MARQEKGNDAFNVEETERRREDALKRMLATPHKPHAKKGESPSKRVRAKAKTADKK